ncbi:DNA primase subunit pri2 [Batrachochytrium dendrobatidis]|nr:DNA primase subunit pri2 [Batrachochytrium dendrobatidis]KAK5671107.1 DNA primase subunit pri2 [Batrachochytrium dendrobatidis]
MYSTPPKDELSLYEFETYALDRLRVLRAIETAHLRFKHIGDVAAVKYIDPVLTSHLDLKRNTLLNTVGPSVLYEQRRKDHISHFILRMAYCRTEDLRQWFIKQEMALFKYRFGIEQQVDRDAFIHLSNLDFTAVSFEDMCKLRMETSAGHITKQEAVQKLVMDLRATYTGPHNASMQAQLADIDTIRSLTFYRVSFEQVCELVGKRSVLLIQGMAYVPEHERSVLVVNAFKDQLTAHLIAAAKALPRLDEDDRLVPILNSLAKQYLSNEYTPSGKVSKDVGHEDIDGLAVHFPPCMQSLHSSLKQTSHLKHQGRLQLGLFLKGIGLSLGEALIFWRKSFHRMSDDEFSKKGYLYNVRYNYGQEGKRTNYTPYSCVKIITGAQPGAGDAHGCPFRHFSQESLGTMMQRLKVDGANAQEVLQTAKNGHYQIACTKLFELTRGHVHAAVSAVQNRNKKKDGNDEAELVGAMNSMGLIEPIEHPNQWFDLSIASIGRTKDADTKGKMEHSLTGNAMNIER